MEKVTGVGGLFFRAQDPQCCSASWRRDYAGGLPRRALAPQSGPTAFSPFPETSPDFGYGRC